MPTLTVEDMEALLTKTRADVAREKELRAEVQRQLESVQNGYRVERSALENRIAQLRADYEELLNEFRGVSEQRVPIPEADASLTVDEHIAVVERQVVHLYSSHDDSIVCGADPSKRVFLTRHPEQTTCPSCRGGA